MHDVSEIADAIGRVDEGMQKLKSSGLTDRAIVALLQDATGMSKGSIQNVLVGLAGLRKLYLAPKPKA